MLRFRQKWPNAAECCGREVQTNRLGRKRAWWAQGTAIDKFEEDIQPEIEVFLKNVDLNDADIYFRVYMIGRTEEVSRPTIMICCADVSIGRRAKESLRHSPVIRNNPGFCLGSIDFPLEQLVPVRGLALEVKPLGQVLDDASRPAATIPIFATSDVATVGRRLFITHPQTMEIYRQSTGGVVVANNGRFYQLTVGHIADLPDGAHQPPRLDPDACSFDGQSDSDFGDDFSVFEQDLRRASVSVLDLSQSESSDAETEKSEANTVGHRSPANTDYTTTNSDPTGFYRTKCLEQPHMIKVGTIAWNSKDGGKPGLDYALVAIHPPKEVDQINIVIPGTGDDTRPLPIQDVAEVGRDERRVIAITGSSGVVKGILVPGITFLGRGNQKGPQKLYVLQLNGFVAEGDSGAAVVDEISGTFYGHMVSGCPGTRIAYIIAAIDIFQDLESELLGQVTIASQKTCQKSPIQSPTLSSLSSISTSVLEEPDHLPNCTTLDESQVSSATSGEKNSIPKTMECVSINGGPKVLVTASRHSVPHAQINKLHNKVKSLATVSQTPERHSSNKRRKKTKKTKKTGRRQRQQPQGQRVKTYKPSLRRFDVEPEGGSTLFSPQEKSQASIERAMRLENDLYLADVDSDDESDESLLTLLFERSQEFSRQTEFMQMNYNCCSLRDLQRPAYFNCLRKTCLLDDRTNDGTNSVSLGPNEPLSVEGLYQKLREQRFCSLTESSPGPVGHKSALPDQEALPLSADRRLIYIQDIDSYGIAVLIATASKLQGQSLGRILYMYLGLQPGISLSFQGYIHMSFCLPTYVWTTTRRRPQDGRLKRSGQSLRTVHDVSFLGAGSGSKSNSGEVDYLCEAQTCISITGLDRWHWTGLCLVDTYFEPESRREDVSDYCICTEDEDSLSLDPFSVGELDADRPLLDPKEYFLRVMDIRARAFLVEWQCSVSGLRQNILKYVSTFEYMRNTTSEERPNFEKGLIWSRQTKHLLNLLIQCLEGTIHHWDHSRIAEKVYGNFSLQCLSGIQETFSNAKLCARELETLSRICDEHARAIELAMISERTDYLRFETKVWKDVQTLKSFVLFLCFPTSLAAAMLSMSEKATPSFLGPNKLSFFVLSPLLILLVFVLATVIHYWDWILNSLCQLGKSIQVYMFDLERLPRSNTDRRSDVELADS